MRIKQHTGLHHLNGLCRLPRKHQAKTKTVIDEIGIQSEGSLVLDKAFRVSTVEHQGRPKNGARLRQIGIDLYRPANCAIDTKLPAVLFIAGYPDPGFERIFGCRFKDLGSTESWARLLAASGLASIAYSNEDPEPDVHKMLAYIQRNADALGIDEKRIGIWASSGNGPLAVSLLLKEHEGYGFLKCAVLCYAYTLDAGKAAAQWKFANPAGGKSVADLRTDVPMFIARAGRDQFADLNEGLDRFASHALAANLPVMIVNHPEGGHAFDIYEDNDASRAIIRQIIAFLMHQLR